MATQTRPVDSIKFGERIREDPGDIDALAASIEANWKAAMELGHGDMKAQCVVYRGLSLQEEAALFLLLNDSKNTSALDRFKAGLTAGDTVCIGIRDTLAHYGLKISSGGTDGSIGCVAKIEALYKKDPAALDSLCLILTEAWGTRSSAFEQIVVVGVGKVVGRYNGELDEASLIKKLSGYRGGPTVLAGDARGYADVRPISVGRACAEIIVDTYNKGRRSKALPAL